MLSEDRAVWGSKADDVYAVGDGGTILHTANGGMSWEAQSSGTMTGLVGLWGGGSGDVFVVGQRGTILHLQ
jgi:photosystem II stability/assembly factor-like uncharacterized protein